MRIKTLFLTGLSLVAIPGAAACLWLAVDAAQEMSRTEGAITDLRAAADAQRAASATAVEVGQYATQLRAERPERDVLARDAATNDRRLAAVAASAAASGLDMALVAKVTAEVGDIRARMLASIALPLAQRDPNLPAAATAVRNGAVDGLMALAARASRKVALAAPDLALLIEASSLVMDMRDAAGRRNTMMQAWIGGAPVTEANFTPVEVLTGRLDQSWQTVQRVLAAVSRSDRLDAALRRARDSFAADHEARWRETTGMARARLGQPATPWPWTMAEFRGWTVPAQANILVLRDAVLDEAMSDAADTVQAAQVRFATAAALAVLAFAAAVLGVMLLLRQLLRPLHDLTGCVTRIAGGALDVTVPGAGRRDELGGMAGAVETLRQASLERVALAEAQAREQQVRLERGQRMETLLKGFEAETADMLRAVAAAATELDATATATGMAGIAANGSAHAASVAESAEKASGNVQTVAAATEELSASISEVARQIGGAAERAQAAVQAAGQADAIVRGLSEAAGRIGRVVEMITGIAGQTNLLALNATIEAARAGEAGKGFAVVAGEVKALASQTAKATDEIGQQIAAMQTETERTVQAIAAIAGIIEALNAASAQVAEAAGQQADATREIGRAVAEAAQGTAEASRHAQGVSTDAERTGQSAGELRAASEELARRAEGLRGQVDHFLANVRAP
jgi:methyl-accepting chemotaxis protein